MAGGFSAICWQAAGFLLQLGGHDAVDEAPVERPAGVDQIAGEHFHRALARDVATDRDAGVEQKNPQVTPGVVNFAASEATRSHWATSWQPAAAAAPAPGQSPAAAAP